MHTPPAVSVIGTGAVGSALATSLLARDHPVRVWNRTPGVTAPLLERGATALTDVNDALARGGLVLISLTDYRAAEQVLAPLTAQRWDTAPESTLVLLTSGTPEEARRLSQSLAEAGVRFVAGGVQTAPSDIGTHAAAFLYSGSEPGFRDHQHTLEQLGSAIWLGPDPSAAAVWDLSLFGLWYDAQLGLLRALDSLPDDPAARREFAGAAMRQLQHVINSVEDTTEELIHRQYPRGPASLDEHLTLLHRLRAARQQSPLGDGDLANTTRLITALSGRGHGELGLTAVVDRHLLDE